MSSDADRYYAHFRSVLTDPKHPEYETHCAEFRALCKEQAGSGVVGPGGAVFEPSNPLTRGVILTKP